MWRRFLLASLACAVAHGLGEASALAAVTAASSKTSACGVSGVFKDGQFEPPSSMRPVCGRMLETNCSVSYSPMACPSDCQYLAPNKAFTCIFECTTADSCSESNPNTAFADPTTKVCESCSVTGCKVCSARDECETCHPGFELDDKVCAFSLFKSLEPPLHGLLVVLGVLLGVLIIFGLVWHCLRVRGRNDPDFEVNSFAIMRARRHRGLAKVLRWRLGDRHRVAERYSLLANLHTENVLGVGLGLFYNSLLFVICFSLLLFLTTFVVYKSSRVSEALSQFDPDNSLLLRSALKPPEGWPAVVLSRLYVCSSEEHAGLTRDVHRFYAHNCLAIGVLWVLLFVLSLAFATVQKHYAAWFNSQYATMSDFAVTVDGLPRDLVDEAALREWLEQEFRKAVPDKFERPPLKVDGGMLESDTVEPRPDSQVEVWGVSICYDYVDRSEEVYNLVQEMSMRMEVEEASNVDGDMRGLRASHAGGAVRLRKLRKQHREKVAAWFEGDDPLKSTGRAFAVFRFAEDKERVMAGLKKNPLYHGDDPSTPLRLKAVEVEPPSVQWHHMGQSRETLGRNVKIGIAKCVVLVILCQALVFVPYVIFILLPFSRIGSDASGSVIVLAGVVLGALNGILITVTFGFADEVGFHSKEKMESMVLYMSFFTTLLNTLLNLCVLLYTITSRQGESLAGLLSSGSLSAIATLSTLARAVYLTLMPGTFFVGYLLIPVLSGVLPFLLYTLLMKLVYIWRVFPRPMLRPLKALLPYAPPSLDRYPYWSAERAMEPEVVTMGDYSDLLVVPTVCCGMLFFVSPFVWKTFGCMLCWAAFLYCFSRYKHLRLCKASYCTTNHIDSVVNYLWGLPLSVVGAACVFWGIHAYGASLPLYQVVLLLLFSFSCGWGLWALCYRFGVNPHMPVQLEELEHKTVEEVKSSTVYSWLNCNPVYVLKCEYYFCDEAGGSLEERRKGHPIACGEDPSKVRYYEIGKQYLFIKPERQHLATLPYDPLEFEAYLDRGLALFGWAMSLCAARTESGMRDYARVYLKIEDDDDELEDQRGGELVVVKRTFMSHNRTNKQELLAGLEGVVKRFDNDGDALVRFEGLDALQWVSRHHFHNLQGLNGPASVENES